MGDRVLYSDEDIRLLSRIIIRKGYEIAMATMDPDLTEPQRHMKIDHLLWQLSKSRIMIAIGTNEVSDLHLNTHILQTDVPRMSDQSYAAYLDNLNHRDREDESRFIDLDSTLSLNLPYILGAMDPDLGDTCGILDSDMVALGRLNRIAEQDGDGRLSMICRTMLRIGTLKRVTGEELSDALAALGDDLPAPIADSRDRYRTALFARCILNSDNPEMASISDMPVG